MSTQPSTPPPSQSPYYGSGAPPIPIPNMEFVVYIVAILALGLITALAETVAWESFASIGGLLTAAYLISRGLAKLGRATDK